MKVLVCGGRDFDDYELLLLVLDEIKDITEIGHGDARGTDRLAGRYADYRGIPCSTWPADWDAHGKSAGPIRNRKMFKEFKPDLVIAFPGGTGTRDMVSVAQKGRCPVRIVDPEEYVLEFYRASGDCICSVCNLPYRKHPFHSILNWQGDPYLNLLCNGDVVKL